MTQAKEQNAAAPGGETPSMEEILQSIRGVISGDEAPHDDADVLELTEIIEEPIAIAAADVKTATITAAPPTEAAPEKSILDDIDAALDDGTNKPAEAAPAALEEAAKEVPIVTPPAAPEEVPEISLTSEHDHDDHPVIEEIPAIAPQAEEDEDLLVVKEEVAPAAQISTDIAAIIEPQKSSPRLLDEQAVRQSTGSLRALVSTISDKHIDSPQTRSGTSLEELVIEAMKPFLADWLNRNLPAIVKKIVEKEIKHLLPKEEDE